MTGETTSSPRPMSCQRVASDELAEAYLLNRLSEADRDAFEEHCFECTRCFEDLRALEAVGLHLRANSTPQIAPPARWRQWLAPAAIAAALVLAVLAVLWRGASNSPEPPVATPAAHPQPPQPTADAGPVAAPEPAPPLEQLARVEPAPYNPGTFRTVPDEATMRFQRGMERYQQADYPGASAELADAAMLDPAAPHIRFFLGVSQLLSGETAKAIDSLRATAALGDTPYLEESHFYLAKAFLRTGNVAAAQAQLKQAAALDGSKRAEANRMLEQIGRAAR